jgi:hypothetical protein
MSGYKHADGRKNTDAKSTQAVEEAPKRKHDAAIHHTNRIGGALKAI